MYCQKTNNKELQIHQNIHKVDSQQTHICDKKYTQICWQNIIDEFKKQDYNLVNALRRKLCPKIIFK